MNPPTPDRTDPGVPERSPRPVKPYHLRFRHFHRSALRLTEQLMAEKVSRMEPRQQLWHMQQWVDRMSLVYEIPAPTVEFTTHPADGHGVYRPRTNTIYLPKPSLVTLLHEFRHAMQTFGYAAVTEDDARAWSLSLYYRVQPKRLRKLVRQGKVLHLRPEDVATKAQVERLFPET